MSSASLIVRSAVVASVFSLAIYAVASPILIPPPPGPNVAAASPILIPPPPGPNVAAASPILIPPPPGPNVAAA